MDVGIRQTWAQILSILLSSYVALRKSIVSSALKESKNAYFVGL